MKNLLLALLFGNIVYFLWNSLVKAPEINTGVVVHDEASLVPAVKLVAAEGGAGSGPQIVCRSVGPYAELGPAEEAVAALGATGFSANVREAAEQIMVGHWAQVIDIDQRADANRLVAALTEAGLEEAYIVGDETEGYTISLGLFSELPRAESVVAQAADAGVRAVIVERTRDEVRYWVDAATPGPGVLQPYVDTGENLTIEERAIGECPDR